MSDKYIPKNKQNHPWKRRASGSPKAMELARLIQDRSKPLSNEKKP